MFVHMHVQDKVVVENELFEKMKVEAEKCLVQSERIANERLEFESEIYAKVTSSPIDFSCFIVNPHSMAQPCVKRAGWSQKTGEAVN